MGSSQRSSCGSGRQEALRSRQLLITPVVEFELLYSARHADDVAAWQARLAQLRDAPITRAVVRTARSAVSELAARGPLHHRVPVADVLVAADAERGVARSALRPTL
jgi:predicted nucleic acid-binding protein